MNPDARKLGPPPVACTPGMTVTCPCPPNGMLTGTQLCNLYYRYDGCQCGGAGAAGTGAGAGG